MSFFIFVAIITILVLDFGFERLLAFLNIQHSKLQLPTILHDIYDAEKYAKQQNYFRANSQFGMISSSFSFLLSLSMVLSGGFGWLDTQLQGFVTNETLRSLSFFGLLFIANDLLTMPFDLYDTFVIEERFGFNKVTPSIYLADKLKSYALTVVIGGGLLFAIISIFNSFSTYFWLLAWLVVTAFGLFMSLFYSNLIVPLFNKQTPLPEGELRNEIEKFAQKVSFNLTNIFVIDGSKRSTKANAYFTGLGPKKRIVLYDTLMNTMSTDEIVAVLAHEVGHYKHKHTLKTILITLPSTLLMFYLLGLILNSDALAQALGGTAASFHLNILAFGIIYAPISMLLGLFGNMLSRKYEYQADAFAAKAGLGLQLVSGLKKLSATSLSNLMPHPLTVFFHYSHPTLYQRIRNITS
ncbi:MAG: peptidase M48 [Porphyromonadaceae bacterium CG2_30_38_12]|nr:MAG: peptidase M48 [Porphyromonadaceae bacterium CG2_30_38_12]